LRNTKPKRSARQKLHEKAMRNFDERMIEIDRKLKRLLGRLPPE
jgi:hypothetical protein